MTDRVNSNFVIEYLKGRLSPTFGDAINVNIERDPDGYLVIVLCDIPDDPSGRKIFSHYIYKNDDLITPFLDKIIESCIHELYRNWKEESPTPPQPTL